MTEPALSPTTEVQWLEQARSGDRDAMALLLKSCHHSVYLRCRRLVNNPSDAMELTQDTLVRVIDRLDSFQGNCRFKTWVIRIATNLCISYLRKMRLRRAASLESGRSGDDPQLNLRQMLKDPRELAPEQCVSNHERHARLYQALAQLDEPLRQIIVLRDLESKEYDQIADELQVKLGTVKSRLFRARLALRHELEQLDVQ